MWLDVFITYDSCFDKCRKNCEDCVYERSAYRGGLITIRSTAEDCGCLGFPIEWRQTFCLQAVFAAWVRDMAINFQRQSVAIETCAESLSCSSLCLPLGPPNPFVEK